MIRLMNEKRPDLRPRASALFAACVSMVSPAFGQGSDAGVGAGRDGGGVLAVSDLRAAIAALGASSQAERDAAAERVRAAIERDPSLVRSLASASARLVRVRPGMSEAEFVRVTGARTEGMAAGGGGTTGNYRLDDHWIVTVLLDRRGRVREWRQPERATRALWVQPPPRYTGRWVTYFAHGRVAHEIEYLEGHYARFVAFHDNGQRAYEQRYVRGRIDGVEVGYDREGRRAYELHHAMGRNVGRWVHWHPNGRVQSEETWVDGQLQGVSRRWRADGTRETEFHYARGQEIGQAAWDERGTLRYAQGAAASTR
jgi:hypothetical protein